MPSKISDPCTQTVNIQSGTRTTKGIPQAHPLPGRNKAPIPTTPPYHDPGPHHTQLAASPTADNHHGNLIRIEHCKAQTTASPYSRTKINPEVQSNHDTCPHNALQKNSTRDTPHYRQDHAAGKEQPPTTRGGKAARIFRHLDIYCLLSFFCVWSCIDVALPFPVSL